MKKKLVIITCLFLLNINLVYAKDTVMFSSCVDGDTIKVTLEGEVRTVRLLAVDTPESVHPTKGVEYYGKEASEYTCNLVTNAKKIELEYDDNSAKEDKYNRLLAWVFVDDELLQELLVENGYAKVAYLYGDYKYTTKLESIQELASAKNIGIWNEEEKEKYNSTATSEDNSTTTATTTSEDTDTDTETTQFSTQEIIIIVALLLVIALAGKKTTKNKAKRKLKKYLK